MRLLMLFDAVGFSCFFAVVVVAVVVAVVVVAVVFVVVVVNTQDVSCTLLQRMSPLQSFST